jgi:heme-degrading monooxygenase HmoA
MVTVVTEIQLKQGSESQWDRIMRERMAAATKHSGWVSGQLLQPDDDPRRRVIVGTWQSRDDWKQWHTDPRFQTTRAQLDQLVSGPEDCSWHDVVLDLRDDTGHDGAA